MALAAAAKKVRATSPAAGLYTDDFTLPGMLQAMIVRSPHAHARINAVDPSEALKNPNVMAVVTPTDVKQLTKPFKPGRYAAGLKRPIDEYAGAIEKVRYVGEPIGAVAARDRGTAEDALELIQVDYEPLRAVVDVREAIKPSSATLFDELGTNLAWTGSLQYGDIDAAFKSADRVVKENLKIHRYSSTPLEPFVVIASYDAASKRLTVWVTAQVPEVIYDGLREALGLQDIRVIIPDVGGGFGQKIHLIRKYVVLVSLLAMKSGRPVKWIEDRSEHMMAGGHACAQEFECEAAVKNDGTVLGLRFNEYDDVGGSISTLTIHFTNKLNNLSNTYRTPAIHMIGNAVVTNKCPVIPNRGIGKPGMCYIWERMMDRVAQALELSPIEVRRKNLIQPGEMPYRTISGNVYDSGDYPGLLSTLLEKIDYDKLLEEQKQARGRRQADGYRRRHRRRARRTERRARHGDFSGDERAAWLRRRQRRDDQTEKERHPDVCTLVRRIAARHTKPLRRKSRPRFSAQRRIRFSTSIPFDSDLSPWGVAAANSGNNFHLYDIGAIHGAATKLQRKSPPACRLTC